MIPPAAELQLQIEIEDLLQFLYQMPVAVMRLGQRGEVLMLNPKAAQVLEGLGVDASSADGTTILDVLSPGASEQWLATAGQVGATMAPRLCSPPHPGGPPLHLNLLVVRTDERSTMLVVEDVTQAVEQERELARQRRRMALALEQIDGYCVLMLDADGAVVEWNLSIGRLFGKSEGEGASEQLLDWVAHADAEDAVPPFSQLRLALLRQGRVQLQLPWRHSGGHVLWGDLVVTPLFESDGDISGFVAVIRDVTEDHLRKQQLIGDAFNDQLTGVFNRRGLEFKARMLSESSSASATRHAWIMIDIDHFKVVNDRYGHAGGDRVLKAVACALQSAARGEDLLARIGGEEFVFVLSASTESLALCVAERLRQSVESLSITTELGPVRVTASFGVAMQAPREPWANALNRADAALYRVKGSGRNQVQSAEPQASPAV